MAATPNPNPHCPKCSGHMEEGFLVDFSYGHAVPSSWVEGEPVQSLFSGTKVHDRAKFRVRSFRCVSCGYLESYAVPDLG